MTAPFLKCGRRSDITENPDDDKFRSVARELGINEDAYIEALHKVGVKSKEQIKASAQLLGT